MSEVLVIGGAGYIGSHVVKDLLAAGFKVKVYDNLSTGHKCNLFKEAEFVKGDILDFATLDKAMSDVSAVVFLAAKKAVGESMENPAKYALNNINGTVNVLNAMSKNNVKAIVFSSSAAVYGNPQYIPIDENHPLNPLNFYGFTKVETERMLEWYDRLKGIKYASLRYFNAAGYDEAGDIKGKDENPQNLLPIVMSAAMGERPYLEVFGTDYDTEDGTCIRDYIHVSDLAKAHVLAVKKLLAGSSSMTLNLGTGKGTSVKEVIRAFEKVLKIKLPVKYASRRPGDPDKLYASNEEAFKQLGWRPQYLDIEDIVRTFAAVYMK
ncbi:MAG: UDP-glucose 4-epimerase GalE [Alphaproteobacteria bacterium]|nr:UDP-glucose 4-epimerase GalE [Alphaproteobacteria bacterium]